MPSQPQSRDDIFSGVKPVEERHKLDESKLAAWLAANVRDYAGPLEVFQFKGGQSNPTYRLDTPSRSYVLRRKPFGKLLPSAHAVDREYRVITALHAAGFPMPCTYGLCTDDGVIGAMFYVMEMVRGRIFWDGALPTLTPVERSQVYAAEIATLAQLHTYNPDKIGLGDYGKPGNYFARQVERWSKQYRASETGRVESMEKLMEFLPRTVPQQERVSVVHGDYRVDNMIFAADTPKVTASSVMRSTTSACPLVACESGMGLCASGSGMPGMGLPWGQVEGMPSISARRSSTTGESACSSRCASSWARDQSSPSTSVSQRSSRRWRRAMVRAMSSPLVVRRISFLPATLT